MFNLNQDMRRTTITRIVKTPDISIQTTNLTGPMTTETQKLKNTQVTSHFTGMWLTQVNKTQRPRNARIKVIHSQWLQRIMRKSS